ncbi:MAG: SH3 domain-containing protein [Oscillospiraceae bacterium]|nr:SH3 domain-containing protein [Oscillospiraceae bacterium]
MPSVFLSPSTQEWNPYVNGGNEELYMNEIADRMEPYLRSSGISFSRNDPNRNVIGAIADSNAGNYDVHLALHSNAAPEALAGKLRGIDIYYAPGSHYGQILANIIADRFKTIYPIPDKCRARTTTTLGEVTQTRAVAVLCEIGYHDNEQDANWIRNHLNSIAIVLVQSLCEYFGIPFIPAGPVMSGTVQTDGSGLNLRAFPSTQGRILASIPNGTELPLYGKTGDWYVTAYQGMTGYVNANYIVLS